MMKWNRCTWQWVYLSSLVSVAQAAFQHPLHSISYESPAHADWPSLAQWQSFNESLDGRIKALRPWAAVCYRSDPSFDDAECSEVLSGYRNDYARTRVPSALLWANWESCGYGNGCALKYPDAQAVDNSVCHQGTIPPYSFTISNAQDASDAVKLAIAKHVKLTVRNTGHDFLGRSAAPLTLQVNTHEMQHLEYVPRFVPEGSNNSPVPAITMGGGAQLSRVYKLAEEKNVSVVLGTCPTVGAGGFLQAGGLGPLTPAFGPGARHVLEFELVTADGKIRKINKAQDPDLFWAVRGGGAGSWGILTSITIQAYPAMKISVSKLTVEPIAGQNKTQLVIAFIALVGRYQGEWINNGIFSMFSPGENQYSLLLSWPSHTAPLSILFPFFEELRSLSENFKVTSNRTAEAMFNSVSEAEFKLLGPEADRISPYGASMQMSSRLIPQSSLSSPDSAMQAAEAIWAGVQRINAVLSKHPEGTFNKLASPLIFGSLPGGSTRSTVDETGTNPALYQAAWHVMFGSPWTVGISRETSDALASAIQSATGPLTAMGITGSYQAEGSPSELNWQESFFGYKYSSLLAIKEKYDPDNFFNSYKGVGWTANLPTYQCYDKNAV
ncbi:hypothetical protein HYDPIDRAFT_28463 [Hydnomerulius pinastri MD-312]|uniref:FAD-binding PCMH-type domain-containing protein n=1 Tax=Hydnomerulius pinastri MD-312 TaxID=994086 RepID=A0A0C9W9P4_9AGAM|nr:hypothetical protein HYDPIDRAFT_28463 [Hydnomerulius pinastri MD-312]